MVESFLEAQPCTPVVLLYYFTLANAIYIYNTITYAISFPEHARSQVKGRHSSGEIELIQACDWLMADGTLDFQRKFYAWLTSCKI
jgi:hypothetical protein